VNRQDGLSQRATIAALIGLKRKISLAVKCGPAAGIAVALLQFDGMGAIRHGGRAYRPASQGDKENG
jgi:hypothetical protein